MRRSLLSGSAVAVLGGALALGGAVPAQAAGECTVYASWPDHVAYVGSTMAVPATVSDPGHCMDWASYDLNRTDGVHEGSDYWGAPGTQNQSFYANVYGAGTFQLVGDEGLLQVRLTPDG